LPQNPCFNPLQISPTLLYAATAIITAVLTASQHARVFLSRPSVSQSTLVKCGFTPACENSCILFFKFCRNSQGSQTRSQNLCPSHSYLCDYEQPVASYEGYKSVRIQPLTTGKRFVKPGPRKTDKTETKQKLGDLQKICNNSAKCLKHSCNLCVSSATLPSPFAGR
jgi:hypothetical protein